MGIENIIFILVLITAIFLFSKQIRFIRRNILLGRDVDLSDRKAERFAKMARVALGQSKMVKKPISGLLHIVVYIGFVIINIEVLEIIVDGVLGTHRAFAGFMGPFYDALIWSFEWLAIGVLVACVIFLVRRLFLNIKRFRFREMTLWPKTDANIILITEILLMLAFLSMNAADSILQSRGVDHYAEAGSFPISSVLLAPFFEGMSNNSLIVLERFAWWFHIIGILAFLNYLPISKHFHIILAFPNVYYSRLDPKGKFNNMESVTNEVKLMMDPSADPYAAPAEGEAAQEVSRFGAKDVHDLNWKHLMDAYSCTECGRCTEQCPASQTGKLLSPRKIMMDTRDRLEEVGKNIDKHGKDFDDGKDLWSYILEEEIWACTTCNACVEACPVSISPLDIIMEMRRYLVMEESKARPELNSMFSNVENNGAPWQFPPADRDKWIQEMGQ